MSDTKRNGRPPFEVIEPQRQMVSVLRSNGVAVRTIAQNVGCDVNTLRKHFKAELFDGHAQVVAALGAVIVRAGLAGNVYAARYWLSTHGGPEWRVTERREISSSGASASELEAMSTEDLERELATLRAKRAKVENPDEPSGLIH